MAVAARSLRGVALGGPAGTTAWWAHPWRRAALLRHPWLTARWVGWLHLYTEDGFPEVDLILRTRLGPDGRRWFYIRQPHKPQADQGWVSASALGPLTRDDTRLIIDRTHRRATLYRDATVVWNAPVGVGKPSTPTPPGDYWIREKFIVPGPGDSIYGTRAFGTSDYSPYETDWPGGGIVGIHGTNEPWLIPGDPSHGCVRVQDPAVNRLYPLMPLGTPVDIH